MKQFNYTIKDAQGIHARPAGMLVKQCGQFNSKITIEKEGRCVDAKRLLNVMSLGVKQNHEITVTVEGDDEETAVEALQKFFEENL